MPKYSPATIEAMDDSIRKFISKYFSSGSLGNYFTKIKKIKPELYKILMLVFSGKYENAENNPEKILSKDINDTNLIDTLSWGCGTDKCYCQGDTCRYCGCDRM